MMFIDKIREELENGHKIDRKYEGTLEQQKLEGFKINNALDNTRFAEHGLTVSSCLVVDYLSEFIRLVRGLNHEG